MAQLMLPKDKMLKSCGGLSDVCVCVHADRHMHTYTYGTAKETEQMLLIAVMLTAPKLSPLILHNHLHIWM